MSEVRLHLLAEFGLPQVLTFGLKLALDSIVQMFIHFVHFDAK